MPAFGKTTVKAKLVATIASKAFPPFFKMSTPILEASSLAETTAPWMGFFSKFLQPMKNRTKKLSKISFFLILISVIDKIVELFL